MAAILVAIIVSLVGMVAILSVRRASLRRSHDLAMQQIPAPTQLSWRLAESSEMHSLLSGELLSASDELALNQEPIKIDAEMTRGYESRKSGSHLTSAIADGLLSGLPVLEAVRSIDPSVLEAIKESTAAHLHGLPSVHDYVAQHFFDAPSPTADGWFERLTGYVAEQKAASALEAAGHHVTFAATANQPVWDLLVDGHPVQIKEGLSGVRSFLLEHHDVPVYTGEQVASVVKDPLVHGLKGLDSSQIHELTHQSIGGISDVFNPSFHFPIITLAFSSYRETKLLIADKTTFQRAAKNIGMDVVGVGAGAYAGAKTGAVIGSFFTPAGAAAGGLVGGVVGGIGGKLVSNKFRFEPFRIAVADFEASSLRAENAVDAAVVGTRSDVKTLAGTFERQYATRRDALELETSRKLSAIHSEFEASFLQFVDSFLAFLDDLEAQLEADELATMRSLPATSWRAVFWPSVQDQFRTAIVAWFQQAKRAIAIERSLLSAAPRTLSGKREALLRFIRTYRFDGTAMNGHLAVLFQDYLYAQDEARFVQRTANAELLTHRDSVIQRFGTEVANLYEALTATILEWNERMRSKREALLREAATVGIEL